MGFSPRGMQQQWVWSQPSAHLSASQHAGEWVCPLQFVTLEAPERKDVHLCTCVAHNTVRAAVINIKRQQYFQLATCRPSGVLIPAAWSPPWVVTYPQLEGTLQRHYLPQKQHEGEISVKLKYSSTNDQKIALAGLCLTRKR